MAVAIRVTGQDAMNKVLETLKEYKGWAVAEEADEAGRHMHAYVEAAQQHVRAKIRWALKDFSAKGNGLYSCTIVKDPASYQQYMAKGASEDGQPEVIWMAMPGVNATELHETYWRVHAQLEHVKEHTDVVSALVTRLLKKNISCRIAKDVFFEYYDMVTETRNMKLDKYNCYRIIDTAISRVMLERNRCDYEQARDAWWDKVRL